MERCWSDSYGLGLGQVWSSCKSGNEPSGSKKCCATVTFSEGRNGDFYCKTVSISEIKKRRWWMNECGASVEWYCKGNPSTGREFRPSATLFIINPTCTGLGLNPGISGKKPSINRQSHGTASMGSDTVKALDGGLWSQWKKSWPIVQPCPWTSMLGFRKKKHEKLVKSGQMGQNYDRILQDVSKAASLPAFSWLSIIKRSKTLRLCDYWRLKQGSGDQLLSRFDPRTGHVEFMMEKLALRHVYLQLLQFFSPSVSFHHCSILIC